MTYSEDRFILNIYDKEFITLHDTFELTRELNEEDVMYIQSLLKRNTLDTAISEICEYLHDNTLVESYCLTEHNFNTDGEYEDNL